MMIKRLCPGWSDDLKMIWKSYALNRVWQIQNCSFLQDRNDSMIWIKSQACNHAYRPNLSFDQNVPALVKRQNAVQLGCAMKTKEWLYGT